MLTDLLMSEVLEERQSNDSAPLFRELRKRMRQQHAISDSTDVYRSSSGVLNLAISALGAPALGPQMIYRFELGDSREPTRQRALFGIEGCSALPCGNKNLLHDILSISADRAAADIEDQRTMEVKDLLQRSFIAGDETLFNGRWHGAMIARTDESLCSVGEVEEHHHLMFR